jgi:hypothetical protein
LHCKEKQRDGRKPMIGAPIDPPAYGAGCEFQDDECSLVMPKHGKLFHLHVPVEIAMLAGVSRLRCCPNVNSWLIRDLTTAKLSTLFAPRLKTLARVLLAVLSALFEPGPCLGRCGAESTLPPRKVMVLIS